MSAIHCVRFAWLGAVTSTLLICPDAAALQKQAPKTGQHQTQYLSQSRSAGILNSGQSTSQDSAQYQASEAERNRADSAPAEIELRKATVSELIPLGSNLNPIRLDAVFDETISLRQALDKALHDNLPVQIAQSQSESSRWQFYSSLGRFLPDINNSYGDTWQRGQLSLNGRLTLDLRNPYIYSSSGFRYWGFRGGEVLHGALRRRDLMRASGYKLNAAIDDTYLQVGRRYYDLLLKEALVQIQIRAVQTSEEQLAHNLELKENGVVTRLEVLQSRAQLARDRQALINSEYDLRAAAITLSNTLNMRDCPNLIVAESQLVKHRLVDEHMNVADLLAVGIKHRPELKQLEQERLAAGQAVKVARAPLLPRFAFTGQVIGSGATASPSYIYSKPSYAVVAVSGAATQANVVGNAAGALPAVVNGYPLASAGTQAVYPAGVVAVPAQKVSTRMQSLFTLGWQAEWNLPGMGVPDAANVKAAKIEARTAILQLNQKALDVVDEIRLSYLRALTAERRIEQASEEVLAAEEELRVAQERLENGLGTNLDVITAQRDRTQSLTQKAQAIVEFNTSQLQLLRDLGVISIDTVCSGRLYKRESGGKS